MVYQKNTSWRNFLHEGIYDEVVDNIEPIIKSYKSYKAGENLIKHLSRPTLYVYVPKGYGIGCDCPWDPEHKCLIIIRNNELLYSDGRYKIQDHFPVT